MIYIGEFLVNGQKVEPEDKRSNWFVVVDGNKVAVQHFQMGPYHRGWGQVLTGEQDELGHPKVDFTRTLDPGKKQTVRGVTFEHCK